MPKCTGSGIDFGKLGRRVIEADFSGGDLASDGGLMLLRQVDRRSGLTRLSAGKLSDPRDPGRIRHSLRTLLAQRIYRLGCGYEDLNDHARLRNDLMMQTAVDGDEALASAPTLSRLETRAARAQAWALHEVLIAQFIVSHERTPTGLGLVLDVDASDVPLHGRQELRQFRGYYDRHCCLPLPVFCGEAENRIKEAQLDLFGTRASCHKFPANQLRLLRAALAYTLMHRLWALALQATELTSACAATIRVRPLDIGVAMIRNTRRVRLMYASHHPLRELFALAAARLGAASP